MYHPDLLYSDSQLPFGDVGRTMLAHYYNQAMDSHAQGRCRVHLQAAIGG